MTDLETTKELTGSDQGSDLKQLVVFQVGEEGFCIEISRVREINRLVEITKIPESPEYVEGIINLRGEIIPIIDMRKRFGISMQDEMTKENRIMVIETEGKLVGFIVDEVREVLRMSEDKIEATPDLITSDVDRRYIEGVATVDERLLIILNSELLFSKGELQGLGEIKSVA